jgi:hypothetical protein
VEKAFDHAYVRISTDGSNWTTLWQNTDYVTDCEWVYQEFDISAYANDQPTVYIRWTMGSTDGGAAYCGWNLDDVELWALAPSSPATITAARSCLSHDVAGDFCLDLDAVSIEPREAGVLALEFDVSKDVDSVTASVDCAPDAYGVAPTVIADGSSMVTVVFDPALPDQNCCEITLGGDADGTYAVQTLAGDVNLSGDVTTADALLIKPHFGATAGAGTCQFDFNCSGTITTADYSLIKLYFGNLPAACP